MAEPLAEYTVRDYSAVDAQVAQIAERERILTDKLKLANIKQALILAAGGLIAVGIFLLLAGIAYRIAFPSKPEVIEKIEIVEKVIDPQEIIINIPAGSTANQTETISKPSNSSIWGETQTEPRSSTELPSSPSLKPSITSTPLPSEEQEIDQAESVIGSRSVTTFTSVPTNKTGFNDVVTGWRWSSPDAQRPDRQYCYVEKISGVHTTSITIATIEGGVGSPKSMYSASSAAQAGLSQQQWQAFKAKCRWWSVK